MSEQISRVSFIMYLSWKTAFYTLPVDQRGQLITAIYQYIDNDPSYKECLSDPAVSMAFILMKDQLDRDFLSYQKTVERNRANGKKGGRPKNPDKAKKPSGLSGNPKNPSEPDNDNDNDNVNEDDFIKDGKTLHPVFDVPMNKTRYENLCKEYGQQVVDNYVSRAADHIAAKGTKPYSCFASAAANYMKRDGIQPLPKDTPDEEILPFVKDAYI